jgi:hypothetical protein
MSNTSSISDYELSRAATVGAHEVVADDASEPEAKTTKKKVVTADTEDVETA